MCGLGLSHLRPLLIPSVCMLVLSTHSLWAQRSSPVEETPVQHFGIPAQVMGSEAQGHLHFISGGSTLTFGQDLGHTESRIRFCAYRTADYHLSINSETALDHATRTADFRSKEKYFVGSMPSKWLIFAPTFGKVRREATYHLDELEAYGRHIPWAGSLIVRICEQAKAHPHVTRAIRVLLP